MCIECNDLDGASSILDVLIGMISFLYNHFPSCLLNLHLHLTLTLHLHHYMIYSYPDIHSLLDEYQSEVVQSNGRLVWAEGDDEKRMEEYLKGDMINGNDPHETALRMMPRLLAEKAMYA